MRNDITSLRKIEIQEDLLWILHICFAKYTLLRKYYSLRAYARMEYKCIESRVRGNDNEGK